MDSALPLATFGPQLGTAVRHLYSIAPDNRSINFGSYGCPPIAMTNRRLELMREVDRDTDLFFRVAGEQQLSNVRQCVASFIGWAHRPDDLLLVDNAAYAYNVVAQSILFQVSALPKRDGPAKMLLFDRQYPMCKAVNSYWTSRCGPSSALQLRELALSADNVRDESTLVASVLDEFVSGGYSVLLMDHVCWSPAFVFPVEAICRAVRAARPDVFIVIDGAHSVGNIDLVPLFAAQRDALAATGRPLFDAYFSNFHKWLAAPRHAAFLYVESRWQKYVHPCVLSNFYTHRTSEQLAAIDERDAASVQQVQREMQREFFWCGTRDLTNFLVLPDVVRFRRDVLGGEEHIRAYTHNLAFRAAKKVAEIWGSSLVVPQRQRLCALSNVWCPPGCTCEEADAIVARMLQHNKCYGAILHLDGRPFLRISAQVYNCMEDYEHFAHLFLKMLSEFRRSKL